MSLSYSHGGSSTELLGETIGANLRRAAAQYPEAEVMVDAPTGRRWTYARFDAETDVLAAGLIASGLMAGDRVGLWEPNRADGAQLQYATAKAGILLAHINPPYHRPELSNALRQADVRLPVSPGDLKTSHDCP